MSSKTIDGVPRELLQDFLDTALAAGHHYFDNQQLDALRGLLEKPEVKLRPIGKIPLDGRFYLSECKSCGWVGSSEECTEDEALCLQDAGDGCCFGETDEIGADRLLELVQSGAFSKQASQPLQEPVVVVMPNVDELAQIIRKVDGSHTLGAGALAEAILGEVAKLNRVKP